MTKSYNPFEMWGSYVGGIILVLFLSLYPPVIKINLQGIIMSFILGFFIGWGIHSFVRFLKE